LGDTESVVEFEGVARSVQMMSKADVVVVVVDATLSVDKDESMQLLHDVKGIHSVVIAYNKSDLLDEGQMKPATVTTNGLIVTELFVSAKTGQGLDLLKEKLVAAVVGDQVGEERSTRITLQRHFAALSRSCHYLSVAMSSVLAQASNEFVALDVRGAINALSEITGEITTDDILDNIFGKFCIGK